MDRYPKYPHHLSFLGLFVALWAATPSLFAGGEEVVTGKEPTETGAGTPDEPVLPPPELPESEIISTGAGGELTKTKTPEVISTEEAGGEPGGTPSIPTGIPETPAGEPTVTVTTEAEENARIGQALQSADPRSLQGIPPERLGDYITANPRVLTDLPFLLRVAFLGSDAKVRLIDAVDKNIRAQVGKKLQETILSLTQGIRNAVGGLRGEESPALDLFITILKKVGVDPERLVSSLTSEQRETLVTSWTTALDAVMDAFTKVGDKAFEQIKVLPDILFDMITRTIETMKRGAARQIAHVYKVGRAEIERSFEKNENLIKNLRAAGVSPVRLEIAEKRLAELRKFMEEVDETYGYWFEHQSM